MNKLTKILIIVGIAGFILSGMMGGTDFTPLIIPVICGAIYLISKVMDSGPRTS